MAILAEKFVLQVSTLEIKNNKLQVNVCDLKLSAGNF